MWSVDVGDVVVWRSFYHHLPFVYSCALTSQHPQHPPKKQTGAKRGSSPDIAAAAEALADINGAGADGANGAAAAAGRGGVGSRSRGGSRHNNSNNPYLRFGRGVGGGAAVVDSHQQMAQLQLLRARAVAQQQQRVRVGRTRKSFMTEGRLAVLLAGEQPGFEKRAGSRF